MEDIRRHISGNAVGNRRSCPIVFRIRFSHRYGLLQNSLSQLQTFWQKDSAGSQQNFCINNMVCLYRLDNRQYMPFQCAGFLRNSNRSAPFKPMAESLQTCFFPLLQCVGVIFCHTVEISPRASLGRNDTTRIETF